LKVEIKICGINNKESAIASKGAKYIGFVFCRESPRFVEPDIVKRIIPYLSKDQKKVGLFVNAKVNLIKTITFDLGLDIIQLHGDEDIEFIKNVRVLTNRKIIKAIPVRTIQDVKISEEFKNFCDMILFDTKTNTQFGGTGKSFDWKLLKNYKISKKWMVAGGLNINNIREALETIKPDIVDVSSGVEKERGIKCEKKIRDFIKYVREL
jgi:phosphoribosylanthranilate isomerase